MALTIGGTARRIGLALSGGGFRAAAFHLGVMRRLAALGILEHVDLFTCVSGGSIAGATVIKHWADPARLDILDRYLRTRSIAVSSVIGGVLDPFEDRLDKLAASYDRDLFDGATLDGLGGGPRLYVNATNLATGNLFFFVTGGGKPAEMGEHELGVVAAPGFPVCRAVAASSAFPPVFPPLRLDASSYAHASSVEYVTLTDGGVYDNMGINPLVRARNALDYVIEQTGRYPFFLQVWGSHCWDVAQKSPITLADAKRASETAIAAMPATSTLAISPATFFSPSRPRCLRICTKRIAVPMKLEITVPSARPLTPM